MGVDGVAGMGVSSAGMAWELIEKRVLYDGKRMRLEIHEIRDEASGARQSKEVVAHPGAVIVLPVLADGRIVMIRNKRWTVGKMLVELPAGTLEKSEPPINCAGRELLEETGYLAGRMKPLLSFYTSPGILSELMHAFVATELQLKRAHPEEGEEIEVIVVTMEEAMNMIREGEIKDGKTIAVLLTYDKFGR